MKPQGNEVDVCYGWNAMPWEEKGYQDKVEAKSKVSLSPYAIVIQRGWKKTETIDWCEDPQMKMLDGKISNPSIRQSRFKSIVYIRNYYSRSSWAINSNPHFMEVHRRKKFFRMK